MIISWLLRTNQIRWFYFSTFLTCSSGTKVERIEKVSHSQPLMKDFLFLVLTPSSPFNLCQPLNYITLDSTRVVSWWQTPTVLFADYNLRPMEGQNYVYLPQGLNYVYLQQGLSYVSILFFRIHPCRCIKLSGHPQTLHIGAQTSLASTHPTRRCCKVSGS